MKITKSITLTEQEFYEALRLYVYVEMGVRLPTDMNELDMYEADQDRTLVLEWEEAPQPPNSE